MIFDYWFNHRYYMVMYYHCPWIRRIQALCQNFVNSLFYPLIMRCLLTLIIFNSNLNFVTVLQVPWNIWITLWWFLTIWGFIFQIPDATCYVCHHHSVDNLKITKFVTSLRIWIDSTLIWDQWVKRRIWIDLIIANTAKCECRALSVAVAGTCWNYR